MIANRISLFLIGCSTVSLASAGCSSGVMPGSGDASTESASNGDAGSDAAAAVECKKDGEHVGSETEAACCEGLFKSCPNVTMAGDPTPCICSTVECGTPTEPPPPGVNCCPEFGMDCTTTIGGDSQCTCL